MDDERCRDSDCSAICCAARARNQRLSCPKIVCGAQSQMRLSSKKTDIQRSLVESGSSVCYFLMARGVAQLGSAPALGAGGRPFKSARPDNAPVAQVERATAF